MPTYEYKCSACGHMFEEFQSMKAELLRTCPNCKKDALRRIMGGGGGMIFKGKGFYLTDYRKSGGNGEGKPKSSGTNPTKPSETPKSDSSKKDDNSSTPSSSSEKKS